MHDLGEKTAVDKPTGGSALIAALLSFLLLPVPLQGFIKTGVADQLVLSFGHLVSHQQPVIVIKTDGVVFYLQHDLFTDDLMRKNIPVGVIGDLTVPVNFAEHFGRGIIIPGWQGA